MTSNNDSGLCFHYFLYVSRFSRFVEGEEDHVLDAEVTQYEEDMSSLFDDDEIIRNMDKDLVTDDDDDDSMTSLITDDGYEEEVTSAIVTKVNNHSNHSNKHGKAKR